MDLGNELSFGSIPLRSFHDLFSKRLPFLGHIKLSAVNVVSHLGDIIPVPTLFCTTWEVLFKISLIGFLTHRFDPGFRLYYPRSLQRSHRISSHQPRRLWNTPFRRSPNNSSIGDCIYSGIGHDTRNIYRVEADSGCKGKMSTLQLHQRDSHCGPRVDRMESISKILMPEYH